MRNFTRRFLVTSSAVAAILSAAHPSHAASYSLGGGTVTYTGSAPTIFNTTGHDVEADAAPVTVTGVTLGSTPNSFSGLLIERSSNASNNGAINVTFSGAPSSLTSTADALDVYNVGGSNIGDVSLDTTGTTGGNTFITSSGGSAIDVEADTGPITNITVKTGADTISSTSGTGLQAFGEGKISITTAATISGGYAGMTAFAGQNTIISLTGAASVTGNTGMSLHSGATGSTLNIAAGASVTGTGNQPNVWPSYLPGNGAGIISNGGQTIVNAGTVQGTTTGIYLDNYSSEDCPTGPSSCQETKPSGPSSITNSGTIKGTTASIEFAGPGANTLTLQTGSTLVGDAIGSTTAGATNALILQGHGTAKNNFTNFTTLDVQAGDGPWMMEGTTILSGGAKVEAGGNLFQSGVLVAGGDFTNAGTITAFTATLQTKGNFTNSGNVTIDQGFGHLQAKGTYTQTAGSTILNGGTLEGDAGIIATGGTIGGTGTLKGNVTVSGGATVQVGHSPDALQIVGNFGQTGGKIVFEVDPNGMGGFLQSTLVVDPGSTVAISNTEILFDFEDGADPLAFFNSGQFNIDTFFKISNGDLFSSDFNLASVFQGDAFDISAPGFTINSFAFTPGAGATALTETKVPEPGTLALFLGAGLLGLGYFHRRRIFKATS